MIKTQIFIVILVINFVRRPEDYHCGCRPTIYDCFVQLYFFVCDSLPNKIIITRNLIRQDDLSPKNQSER